jgi:hypothetical protein
MEKLQEVRASNERRLVDLVREHPGEFSVETASLHIVVAPNTVRNALNRGVVVRRDHRLYSADLY